MGSDASPAALQTSFKANKKTVGRRAVAESEWGQTMDSWLALVRDYEESKAAGASEKRRRMNKNVNISTDWLYSTTG